MLALFFCYWVAGEPATNLEDFALGNETRSYYAEFEGQPIHCQGIADVDAYLRGARERGAAVGALWLGNSQLHAINQYEPGQENAPLTLFQLLRKDGIDLLTLSQPNASLQEHYVLFEYLRKRLSLSLLILPVVFDDLRETGIRPDITPALHDAATLELVSRTAIGRKIIDRNEAETADNLEETGTGEGLSIQERTERSLNRWLEKSSWLWASRSHIRGEIFVSLYKFRNTVFGIKATSKRRIIRGRYQDNLAALTAIVDSALAAGMQPLLYVVPLRNDVEIPYDPGEYEEFKKDIFHLAGLKGVAVANLEGLVPASLWGSKEATALAGSGEELDFMHFQEGGHQLLARALYKEIKHMYRPEN